MIKKHKLTLVALAALLCAADSTAQNYERGETMVYAPQLHGKTTASGEVYDAGKLTAAHARFPFGTFVSVLNLRNGKSVTVRINDRLPPTQKVISLSAAAAGALDFERDGMAPVELAVVPEKTSPLRKVTGIFSRKKEVYTSGTAGTRSGIFQRNAPKPQPVISSQPSRAVPAASYVPATSQQALAKRVQFGSYANFDNARKLADSLNWNGIPATVQASGNQGSTVHRVVTQERFSSADSARGWIMGNQPLLRGMEPFIVAD